jgi:hypothetical protein
LAEKKILISSDNDESLELVKLKFRPETFYLAGKFIFAVDKEWNSVYYSIDNAKTFKLLGHNLIDPQFNHEFVYYLHNGSPYYIKLDDKTDLKVNKSYISQCIKDRLIKSLQYIDHYFYITTPNVISFALISCLNSRNFKKNFIFFRKSRWN